MMLGSLVNPAYPRTAIGFGNGTVTAVSLQKEGRDRFAIRRAATVDLPVEMLSPSFDYQNIPDEYALAHLLESLVIDAGLGGNKKWSAALPAATARTAIITLDASPASRSELEDVLDWKSETVFGVSAEELRVTRIRISPAASGNARYFCSAVHLGVLAEYERVFTSLGWQAGLILPRVVGESNWFVHSVGDSLLISTQNDGFTALLLRNREPIVVRSVTCSESEIDDEIYRLLMYYQDRVAHNGGDGRLSRLMVLGDPLDKERLYEITAEAVGSELQVVRPNDLGFEIPANNLSFDDLAAPAGLASLAWN